MWSKINKKLGYQKKVSIIFDREEGLKSPFLQKKEVKRFQGF